MTLPGRIAIAALALSGCATALRPVVPGPLENEGEVHLQLQPLPPETARLWIGVASIAAVRSDGVEVPLRAVHNSISGAESKGPRLIAWGRLDPGTWSGFSLHASKAELAGKEIAVPEALRIEAPFRVEARHATVVNAELKSFTAGGELQADFAGGIARKPLYNLSGYCSSAGLHELTVFDKRARSLSAVVPTGRAPWGIALDLLQNRIYVSLAEQDEIQVIDATILEPIGRIQLQAGDSPRELQLTPDRRLLLVANARSNSVSFVDPIGMLEISRVAVGEVPVSILIDRNGSRAYVFNTRSSFVSVIDVGARAVAGTIATEYGPFRGQLNRAGDRLHVLANPSSYLTTYAVPSGEQKGRVYVGLGTTGIKVDSNTDFLFVAQGGARRLAVFAPFAQMPIDYLELPGDASYLAIDDVENTLFALIPERRSIAVVALAGKRLLSEIDVGFEPRVLALFGERN